MEIRFHKLSKLSKYHNFQGAFYFIKMSYVLAELLMPKLGPFQPVKVVEV